MLSQDLILKVKEYISKHRSREAMESRSSLSQKPMIKEPRYGTDTMASKMNMVDLAPSKAKKLDSRKKSFKNKDDIAEFINGNKQPSFSETLFSLIDMRGLTDAEVYKKAHIDRRLFSKIRSMENYHPKKTTVIALGLALESCEREMDHLLSSAGYSLNYCDTLDLLIHYCLEEGEYNLIIVNELLDHFSVGLL